MKTTKKTADKIAWLNTQIINQRKWIESCEANKVSYAGEKGRAIRQADENALKTWELKLKKQKLTVGPISLELAKEIAPEYVEYCQTDGNSDRHWAIFNMIEKQFETITKGQLVVTQKFESLLNDKNEFIVAKVSKVDHNCFQAIDGPVVRVSDGQHSWRVDGSGYCWVL